MPKTSERQPDPKLVLHIGDLLQESLYGRPAGARTPVLLLAAGHRIESELQLQRLREAGFTVVLPSELDTAFPTERRVDPSDSTSPSPSAKQPTAVPVFSAAAPDQELSWRLEAAAQVRKAATDAVRQLIDRVQDGAAPDMDALQQASVTLVSKVAADPLAHAALTCLRQCDDYTIEHSADVAILMVAVGRLLEVPEPELPVLALAGLMHDVGKQRVPQAILRKPAALTVQEFSEIRKHPQYGYDLLSQCPDCPEIVRLVALQHHERLDGSGYPAGLTCPAIHPYSRLAAVADTFDAITANRVYRLGRSPRHAVLELYGSRKRRLDPEAVQALIKLVGVYPVGTRVRLSTGERGVVIAPNPDDTARPIILVDQDCHGRAIPTPFPIELKTSTHRIVGTSH
jgi:HD-GYP domain-containing protein (c-di-GMP phosphodiesterase class II)